MEPGLHWLQLETVTYLVSQLELDDGLSGPCLTQIGRYPTRKGLFEARHLVLMHPFGVHFVKIVILSAFITL